MFNAWITIQYSLYSWQKKLFYFRYWGMRYIQANTIFGKTKLINGELIAKVIEYSYSNFVSATQDQAV
jgi:hypothetical protein